MWIKICGITCLEDAEMAAAAGADALGFVFAESPRRATVEAVRNIAAKLPRPIEKIGVFVDATLEDILSAIQEAALTGVQLHGEDRDRLMQKLRERVGKISRPLHIVRALHYEPDEGRFELALRAASSDAFVQTVLVDTCVPGKQGGTGIPFDWLAARHSFLTNFPNLRLIAAGGLSAANVRQAICTLRPWGVDVSSGVEAVPGRKDSGRIVEFVRVARSAALELN